MLAIVDYGMGNLRSVEKGFLRVGGDVKVVSESGVIDNAAMIQWLDKAANALKQFFFLVPRLDCLDM